MREENRLEDGVRTTVDRRRFLEYFGAVGLGGTLLPGTLLAVAQDAPEIKPEMVAAAARIAGVPLTPEAEKDIADGLNRRGSLLQDFQALRDMGLGNDTPSALAFNPVLPGTPLPAREVAPEDDEDADRQTPDRRGPGLPAGDPSRRPPQETGDQVRRPDPALPRAAEKIRSRSPLRRDPDGGPGHGAGGPGRQGDRRGAISRTPSRRALGRQGPARGQGIQNDLRRLAVQGPDDRLGTRPSSSG